MCDSADPCFAFPALAVLYSIGMSSNHILNSLISFFIAWDLGTQCDKEAKGRDEIQCNEKRGNM